MSLGIQPHAVSYLGTKVATYLAAPSFRSYTEDGGKMLLRYFTNYLSNCYTSEHNSLQIVFLPYFITNDNRKSLKYHLPVYSGFGGLGVACWPLVPKFAGSNPTEAVGFFRAKKSSARLPSEGR